MIEWLNFAARLVLAVILVVAALAKVSDREGVSRAIRQLLGANEQTAGLVGLALPAVELALALLLIPATTAWGAAVAICALLVAFTAVLARSLRRGEEVECNCFGVLSAGRIGRTTIGRNAALLGLAAFVAATSSTSGRQIGLGSTADAVKESDTNLAVAILGALILLQGVGLLLLFLRYRNLRTLVVAPRLQAPTDVLQPGDPLPDFELTNIDGRTFRLANVLAPPRGALFVFTDPLCGQCSSVLPLIGYAHALGPQGTRSLPWSLRVRSTRIGRERKSTGYLSS